MLFLLHVDLSISSFAYMVISRLRRVLNIHTGKKPQN